MHEIFIYSGLENGDYTGSKHYTVYKLNVISQCSSVTPYLVLFSFFYQDYSFTQLIQVITLKNKPDISFFHYKLEIYTVGVKISGNFFFKKNVHLTRSQFHLESGGPF